MAIDILPQSASHGPAPTAPRQPYVRIAGVALVVAALVAGGLYWTHRSSSKNSAVNVTKLSAPQILAQAKVAMTKASAVHLAVSLTGDGQVATGSVNAGLTAGNQTISRGSAHVQVLASSSYTYVEGNAAGLEQLLGFSPKQTAQLGAHWLRLNPNDSPYAQITRGLTLPSIRDDGLVFTGALTKVAETTKLGQRVVGVSGSVGGPDAETGETAVLWVSATGNALPVEFDSTAPDGTAIISFSRWGTTISNPVPTDFEVVTKDVDSSARYDAAARSDLRNAATAEETYLTDNPSAYLVCTGAAACAKPASLGGSGLTIGAGDKIAVGADGSNGYCAVALSRSGKYFIYDSEAGGLASYASATAPTAANDSIPSGACATVRPFPVPAA